MKCRTKAEQEKKLVDYIISVGNIIGYAEIVDEKQRINYEFHLADGTRMYWADMSLENLNRLGIKSNT